MIELSPLRKNKISLSDYNYQRDIENRLLMAQFSTLDLEILEEILYSSLTISLRKLAKNVDIDEEELKGILEKFSKTGLLSLESDAIVVDKEMRKYFEAQIMKFDEEFHPGMEFLQGLLKKVPIHVLPLWYAIPRTSNNIFDSLIEKFLYTPLIYQRYLSELNLGDHRLIALIQDVHSSHDLKVPSAELIEKYELSREQFEEIMLYLEFNFVCCLGYKKVGTLWQEVVCPFHEWREYLLFMRDTNAKPIPTPEKIIRKRPSDYAFIEDLAALLIVAKKKPIPVTAQGIDKYALDTSSLPDSFEEIEPFYVQELLTKLRMLKFADIVDGRLYALGAANDWLDMNLENRALFIYRHPFGWMLSCSAAHHLCTEKNIREAEKSVARVLKSGWVYFDDFLKGVLVPLGEKSTIVLKRAGRSWKYTLPEYDDSEKAFIKSIVASWLFEIGMVAIGTHDGRECFCVTPLGKSFFGQ